MKTIILFALGISLCNGNILAQTKAKKDNQNPAQSIADAEQQKVKGRFFFREGELHNLGILKKGRIVLDTFWFENIGNSPIDISFITPSSSMITTDWTKGQVRPEKIGYISYVVKTNKKSGPFSAMLYVQSDAINTKGKKFYTLYIKGDIREGGKQTAKKKPIVKKPAKKKRVKKHPKTDD